MSFRRPSRWSASIPAPSGIGIQADLASDVGPVLVRPQALQQVLVNLLLNSLDAMADVREPKLIVKTSRKERWYVIEVIDNGIGIKPEDLERVFEPFFTTKPVGKGTGLGLSISYNLIRRMRGRIDVTQPSGCRHDLDDSPAGAGGGAGRGIG